MLALKPPGPDEFFKDVHTITVNAVVPLSPGIETCRLRQRSTNARYFQSSAMAAAKMVDQFERITAVRLV
jgi:hypothetical protein